MNRHIIDRAHATSSNAGALRAFLRRERAKLPPRPVVKAQRQPRTRNAGARLRAFLRIERAQG